jgi:hypothetical protein
MGLEIMIAIAILISIPMLPILFVMASWYELGLDRATAQSLVPRKLEPRTLEPRTRAA